MGALVLIAELGSHKSYPRAEQQSSDASTILGALVFSANTCAIRATDFRAYIYTVGASSHLSSVDPAIRVSCQLASVPSTVGGAVNTLSDINTVSYGHYHRFIEYANRPPNRAAVGLAKLVCAVSITVVISANGNPCRTFDDDSRACY